MKRSILTLFRALMAVCLLLSAGSGGVLAMEAIPGLADSPPQPQASDSDTANQSAFPYYYNAGMPDDNDLVHFGDVPSATETRPHVPDIMSANQSAFPDVYTDARLLQSKTILEAEITRTRAAFNLLKSYCESNELENADEIYASMPPFGDNGLLNEYRAEAAGILILEYCRSGELTGARAVYDALPKEVPGDAAMLAKGRAIINLTTYYVMGEAYNDAYNVLMDIGWIIDRDELNDELFKLMTRMIPYLDNADETDKARSVYAFLLRQVRTPETARLFADNFPALSRYFLHFAKNEELKGRREERLEFMRLIFESLEPLADNPDIALLRVNLAAELSDYYTNAGDLDKARGYYNVMREADKNPLLNR